MSRRQISIRKAGTANSARPRTPADVFDSQPAAVRQLAHQLRQLIFRTLPDLTEAAYGGAKVRLTLFSLGSPTNTVCGIQPGAAGCLLYFHHIVPEDSSILKIEGQGKHARHIKIEALDRPMTDEIRRLLLLARSRAA
jgi:hypothetical protein